MRMKEMSAENASAWCGAGRKLVCSKANVE